MSRAELAISNSARDFIGRWVEPNSDTAAETERIIREAASDLLMDAATLRATLGVPLPVAINAIAEAAKGAGKEMQRPDIFGTSDQSEGAAA